MAIDTTEIRRIKRGLTLTAVFDAMTKMCARDNVDLVKNVCQNSLMTKQKVSAHV